MISERRHQWRSFAGGELSEEMYGRVDLPRHAIGLKECYNATITPQGAIENRAGTRFISTTNGNNPAWLVPFVRSDGQGFLVEFGDATIRVVGGGNIINEEPAPIDTLTITAVDIWVPADGLPVTPVVFTCVGHGLSPGDPIRFQGFTLVNPDQAGINRLASFMNVTWYVATTPTADTFTISATDTPPIAYATLDAANLNLELGASGWTFAGDGNGSIANAAPTYDGTWKITANDTGGNNQKTAINNTKFPTTAGKTETVTGKFYCWGTSDADRTRADLRIYWYDAGLSLISFTSLDPDSTKIGIHDRIVFEGGAGSRGGLIGLGALSQWVTLTTRAAAPVNATSFSVGAAFNWMPDGAWYADGFTVGLDTRETWSDFSYLPYNGLVTPGTAALTSATTPITLAPTYTYSHIRFASFSQFVDDLVIAHKLYPTAKLTRSSDNVWSFTALSFNQTLAAPGTITVTAQGTPGTPAITYTYTVTTLNDDGAESAVGTPDNADNTLRTLGNFNDITWGSVTDAFRYNVYKDIGGSAYGFIGASEGASLTDDNVTPDYTKQPPVVLSAFGAPGAYPGTVCFHEQRMVLGGTIDEPQSFYVSGLAAFDYFKASVPPQDDQAFTYELTSQKSAPILHSLALNELLFFTSGGVQRVVATDGNLFTPTTIAGRPVVSYGAHELAKPQEAGVNILYPVERGGHLYEMTPADNISGYDLEDRSIIAAHLIDGKDWIQTAIRRAPFPVWYGLRNDGIIVALTYMPKQEVYAWYTIALPGAVIESIAVVPEGKYDSLYVVANRTISGNEVRYIERVDARDFGDDQNEAFFVDCGITYRGAETNTVTGLDHLEGEDVMAVADGRVLGPYTVTSGAIEIDDLASVIHVGLSYTTRVETVPLSYVNEPGYGVGIMKNISQIWLRLKRALGLKAGVSFDDQDLKDLETDDTELLGAVPALRSGVVAVDSYPSWNIDTTICIYQDQPLPFTITGMAVDFAEG